MKNIVNRLEVLRLANHKVEEADRLISEQEWNINLTLISTYPFYHT
jgi:hypothetical protein